ncbi:hypothetical protein HPB49_016748 [Dermacentor silvarum]|uniref:Uncharacterized protein n=1 Tax=Dermacentor silvarum TaxID=543639 RepID=A0ACB8E195_DERSI|nr:hypothetical protein HPB49_016748 [Dermacentor silvarum]
MLPHTTPGVSHQASAVLDGLARGLVRPGRGPVLPGAHHADRNRYDYVVAHLNTRYANEVQDILANHTTAPEDCTDYEHLKTALSAACRSRKNRRYDNFSPQSLLSANLRSSCA